MINITPSYPYPPTIELSDEEKKLLFSRAEVAEKLSQNRYENGVKERTNKGNTGK
jgi:hypothetical protein